MIRGLMSPLFTRNLKITNFPVKNQWLEDKKTYWGKFPIFRGKLSIFSGGHPSVRSDGIRGRVILSSVETSFNEPNDLK